VARVREKVAVVSGAARGQGRAHAVALAREGADIVAFDVCEPLESALTPGSTQGDLDETARLVQEHGRRCMAVKADARDLAALSALAAEAMDAFGRIDVLIVNHGMWTVAENTWELDESSWQEAIDVLLTGAWKVCKAFIPKILAGDRGGSIVLTGSSNAALPQPSAVAYCAAKAGVVNMMRVLAWELGSSSVRVNAVSPGGIETVMVMEGGTFQRAEKFQPRFHSVNRALLPTKSASGAIGLIPPESVSDAVVWLCSDEARYVTGIVLPIDAGSTNF
jgi:(+)-trans-carveol dehydrogenase